MSGDSVGVHLDRREPVTTELSLNSDKSMVIAYYQRAQLRCLHWSWVWGDGVETKSILFAARHTSFGIEGVAKVTWKADGRVLVTRTVRCPSSGCRPQKCVSWMETCGGGGPPARPYVGAGCLVSESMWKGCHVTDVTNSRLLTARYNQPSYGWETVNHRKSLKSMKSNAAPDIMLQSLHSLTAVCLEFFWFF